MTENHTGIEEVDHHLQDVTSSGRGGAGNIRSRSASREAHNRGTSKERNSLGHLIDKVTHPHGHGHGHGHPAEETVPEE
jgi:hypothetical protein